MDPGVTGRLEVTVFANSKTEKGEGVVVHSKKATSKYIHDDYNSFYTAVADAIGWGL